MTDAELRRLLKVSGVTTWRIRKCGELPYFRIAGRIRYRRQDVEQFIERRREEAEGFTFVDGQRLVT